MDWRGLEELGMWEVYSFFLLVSLCDVFFNQQQSSSRIYLLDLNRVYKHIVHIFSFWHMFFTSCCCSCAFFKKKKATAAAAFHTANYST